MSSFQRTRPIAQATRLVALLASLAVLVAAGCRSETLKPELVSPDAVMLDLPIVHQDELYECGLVSITALCQYYHVEIPRSERVALIKIAHDRHGLSGAELRDELVKLGMEVYIFPGTLDHAETGLYHHADDGRPLLVMRATSSKSNHYCLLLGYDEPLGNVFLLDPIEGRISTSARVFENEWRRAGCFTLLAMPAQSAESPPTASQSL